MAQTELMLRLIKDGKIVGYEWHQYNPVEKRMFVYRVVGRELSSNSLDWEGYPHIHFILEYDSFELGIKVGDEWWFEGDIVRREWQRNINGTLKYDGFRWLVEPDIKEFPFYIHDKTDFKHWNRIGNIHEEEK